MGESEAPGDRVSDAASQQGAAPDGARARTARTLGVVATETVLVTSGCVFVTIGLVDLGTSETLVSKLFAGVLALIGCGLLAAGAGFRRRRPWAGVAGTVSLVAAFAFALYLALNARNEEPVWSLVFGAVALGSAVAIVALVRRCPPSFGVKSASILSVAGFALGFFQFSYAESARVRVGSTLTLSTDLVPASGGDGAITGTIQTVNPTAAKIQSLGSLYVVEGVRLCRRPEGVREHAYFRDTFGDQRDVGSFSPRLAEQDVEMIQAGKIFEDRTYFEPGEEIVRRFAVAIPESGYDVVRLRVVAAVANGDRLRLGEVVWGPAPLRPRRDGMNGIGVRYKVSEGSLVDRMLHADRVVEVLWESGGDELRPELWASASLAHDRGADRSTSYGIAFTRSTTELPLAGAQLGAAAARPAHRARDAAPVLRMRAATFLAVVPRHKPKPHKPKPHKGGRHKGEAHAAADEIDPVAPDDDESGGADESNDKPTPGTTNPIQPGSPDDDGEPNAGSAPPWAGPAPVDGTIPGATAPEVRPPRPPRGNRNRSSRNSSTAPARSPSRCA